jgi:hypothetical protein
MFAPEKAPPLSAFFSQHCLMLVPAIVLGLMLIGLPPAVSGYDIPEFRQGRYQSNEVGLMPIEREKLATEIAGFVIQHHTEGVLKAEPVATTLAQRLLALCDGPDLSRGRRVVHRRRPGPRTDDHLRPHGAVGPRALREADGGLAPQHGRLVYLA